MSLKIIKAGVLDTIQDAGRYGYRHLGINPSGAMDRFSAQLANALLGKNLDAPVIELHFPVSVFLFQKPTIACVTGADFSATLNDQWVPLHQPFIVAENCTLQFKKWVRSARAYLALLHDLVVDEWLQSTSTNLKANAGGWKGRRLEKDDCIPFKEDVDIIRIGNNRDVAILPWKVSPPPINTTINCIKGKEWDWLTPQAQWGFENVGFIITSLSDRMGYRLNSEPLTVEKNEPLVSSAVDFGTVQLLPNGQLIVLMADHQTTGGYPRVAHVSSASLSSLAQLKPNDEIRFRLVRLPEAEEALLHQKQYLEQLQNTCKLKVETFLHASL